MNKEFIPYEQALTLKELGFDEQCLAVFKNEKFKLVSHLLYEEAANYHSISNSEFSIDGIDITAPLYQQAFKWFREKYNICNTISSDDPSRVDTYWFACIFGDTPDKQDLKFYMLDSYEEAELACLKKIIELIK